MLQIIVNICSVAAFALSVFNLCRSVFFHRRALEIPSATLFEYRPDQRHVFAARIIVSNLSECPISICDLRLCDGEDAIAPLPVPARLFCFENRHTGARQEIYATPLPVRLGALESKEIFAAYPSQYSSIQELQSRLLQRDRLGREYIRCCAQTTRGTFSIRIQELRMLPPDSVLDVLESNCRS